MEAMTMVLRKCREASVMSFIFANDLKYARPLIEAGWDMVAIGYGYDLVLNSSL